jgi:hypothetical protein
MKYLKMLGLAAVAAMALMAFVGAGTASATGGVLCEDTSEPCEEASKWKVNAHMTFNLKEGVKSQFTTEGGAALRACEVSKLTGKVTKVGTATEKAAAEVKGEWLTFAECEGKVQQTVTSGSIEFTWRAAEKGTKGTVYANNLVITTEVVGVHCYYKTGVGLDIGLFTPGTEGKDGKLAVNTVLPKENTPTHPSGFLCPATVVWHAEYTQSGTTPLYIK